MKYQINCMYSDFVCMWYVYVCRYIYMFLCALQVLYLVFTSSSLRRFRNIRSNQSIYIHLMCIRFQGNVDSIYIYIYKYFLYIYQNSLSLSLSLSVCVFHTYTIEKLLFPLSHTHHQASDLMNVCVCMSNNTNHLYGRGGGLSGQICPPFFLCVEDTYISLPS